MITRGVIGRLLMDRMTEVCLGTEPGGSVPGQGHVGKGQFTESTKDLLFPCVQRQQRWSWTESMKEHTLERFRYVIENISYLKRKHMKTLSGSFC